MSTTANWSYTALATIYPVIRGGGKLDDTITYGPPYLIDCTFRGSNEVAKDDFGTEFVTKDLYNTEMKYQGQPVRHPVRGDYIAQEDTTDILDPRLANASQIVVVSKDDMSFFGESYDYVIRT
ncbi:hypothetical protein ACPS97_003656 [Providencia rettgeri]|uniref:hypothetical protein n=1 Tax=Providencia rettgeri TaxID=587 RepID=UPI0028938E39|nr:hypothetical protein [Providencia rettgeri]ELM3939629.1 hypothetical protein [Providencia rettgeri]EMA4647235.1 hypothetical protein [Providencia rettgeri]WRR95936.1 hypothetical protein VNI59_14360 [Providencia rettgeri]